MTDNHSPENQNSKDYLKPIKQWFERWRERRKGKWKDTPVHERETVRLTRIIAISTVCYTIVAGWTLHEIHTGSTDTHNLSQAARDSATWNERQAKNLFDDQRPLIWVKMPDSIRIEVNKPISPDIEVFNYGKIPGIARARIRFEAGPGVIDNFRRTIRKDPQYLEILDEIGTLKAAILPGYGRPLPIETPEVVLSRENIKQLTAGTIDVAIYGRIFYTDLANEAQGVRFFWDESGAGIKRAALYESLFCFYIMRDGTTISACPNQTVPKEEAFTNWAP